MTLSNLKRIELRKHFADKACDFTPWLSSGKGLAMLGEISSIRETFIGFQEYLYTGGR
jgi:hypothetical protein